MCKQSKRAAIVSNPLTMRQPKVKLYNELILLLHDETINEIPAWITPQNGTKIISLGDFAAIKLSRLQYGIYVRILKHRQSEDLFPADYILHETGRIRISKTYPCQPCGGKYDFEVHVDEVCAELLRTIDWDDQALRSWRSSATTLKSVESGRWGNLRTGIFVKSERGDVKEYTNDRVGLEVVEFEIYDEDGGGIFEPGGIIRVESIKIRNFGSLISPDGVPLFIVPTKWIQPIDDGIKVDAISPDSVVVLEGCLRVVICQGILNKSTNLCVQDTIRLTLKSTDLAMKPSVIPIEKAITIQYPLKLDVLSCPRWIAPGSKSDISWAITNISDIKITRQFATSISIHDSKNTLIFSKSPQRTEICNLFTSINPAESLTISESMKTMDMESSSNAIILIELFLSESETDLQSYTRISSVEIPITIAKPLRYTYGDLLLVSNIRTTNSEILQWKQFLDATGLTVDIYNFGLYGTFQPNGMDVLRLYSGKTVIILGNKYRQESGSTSIVDCLDVVEVAKALAEGTTIFICDVEKSRMGEMRRWIADVVHESSIPTIDGFVDKDGLIRCLQARKDDTRYILTTKISQTKFADNLLGRLQKEFPSRRFTVSKHDVSKISVRESLDVYASIAVTFDDAKANHLQYSFISILPYSSRIQLLWSCFVKNRRVTEYLTWSIAYDILLEQQSYQQSRLAREFLSFQGHLLESHSIDFIVMILSAVSQTREYKSSSKGFEIQRFIQRHYPPEARKTLNLRLRKSRKLVLKDIRTKIASACGFDERAYHSKILHSSDIASEIRDAIPRRLDTYDHSRKKFEAMFSNHLDELLDFTDSSPHSVSPFNTKLT